MTEPQPTRHDPRDCHLCGTLRHPGTAKAGRALAAHLDVRPLPQQNAGAAR